VQGYQNTGLDGLPRNELEYRIFLEIENGKCRYSADELKKTHSKKYNYFLSSKEWCEKQPEFYKEG